jgi:hypothetical protein
MHMSALIALVLAIACDRERLAALRSIEPEARPGRAARDEALPLIDNGPGKAAHRSRLPM